LREASARWRAAARFLHPAAILAMALAIAAALFLTKSELRSLIGTEDTIVKLLGGTALLYLVGLYFTQQASFRSTELAARAILESNAADLARMKAALKTHIAKSGAVSDDRAQS
jgi:hypothetical protein